MTKPVQIQRWKYIPRTTTFEGELGGYLSKSDDGDMVNYDDHQAALLRVCSLLEAKAEDLQAQAQQLDEISTADVDVERSRTLIECASELLTLAATLGNQALTNDAGEGA